MLESLQKRTYIVFDKDLNFTVDTHTGFGIQGRELIQKGENHTMAVEVKDGKKILVTPISAEDLKDIHLVILYIRQEISQPVDVAHRRVVEEGERFRRCQKCSNPARISYHSSAGR